MTAVSKEKSTVMIEEIWNAAAAAFRINGRRYVKEAVYTYDDHGQGTKVQDRNSVICYDILKDNSQAVTDEDRVTADACRTWISNDLIMRTLKGRINSFDEIVKKILAMEGPVDTRHSYNYATVCSLFSSWQRGVERESTDSRLRETTGEYLAAVGDKITTEAEVLKSIYSQQWNTNYVTAVDTNNCAVFFSYRTKLEPGARVHIAGTVKAHRDGSTQLNRVRVTQKNG
jgi:hypothetical protein